MAKHMNSLKDGGGEEGASIVGSLYNPRKSLSIERQRALLPAARRRGAILAALERSRCVVIMGSTGSGKTTQVPQFLADAGWCSGDRAIAITEPRRVAAVAAAERVAEERGTQLGSEVGVSIQFQHRISRDTTIVFTTEGTLLRSMMSDPLLRRYSVVMVDEAHEGSVTCDLLLGLLKKIQRRRGDLRLIVSSASFSTKDFLKFFGPKETTIINIEGKMYPVDIAYLERPSPNYFEEALRIVIDIHNQNSVSSGAILVFLTSGEECERFAGLVAEELRNEVVACPLYASLPFDAQVEALEPAPRARRKVIAATNVAETSLTIDGVAYVIDALFAKVKSFSVKTSLSALTTVPISQASAKQRAGRAGRTRPGQCFRLCTKESFLQLVPATPPEIQRSDFTRSILQLKAFGVNELMSFSLPTSPPVEAVAQALDRLYSLGAIDDMGSLTENVGVRMAEMPLEPELARCLLASEKLDCAEEMASILGMLESSTLLISASAQRDRKAFEATREPYAVAEGDLLTFLNMFNAYKHGGYSSSWCRNKGFNSKGFKQARKVARNLFRFVGGSDKAGRPAADATGRLETRIQKAICTGLFHRASFVAANGSYKCALSGAGQHSETLRMHPTSVLFDRYPKCVVFAEGVQTTMKYMRNVTVVEQKWLVEIAPTCFEDRRKRAISELEVGLQRAQTGEKHRRK